MKTGVSYFGNRSLEYVKQDLKKIKKNHCSYVVFTFSEEDFYFYKERMKEILEEAKKMGLYTKLDPWGVGGFFGGETFSKFVAHNLDVRQINSAGESSPLACLNHPRTLEFMKEWVEAAVEIGAEEIFWDEPHFYEPGWLGFNDDRDVWGCRCKFCQDKFNQIYSSKMPKEGTEEVLSFKNRSLVDFLTVMCDYAKEKGLKNSTCLLPKVESLKTDIWDNVAAIKSLDNIGTDPYWIEVKKGEKDFNLGGHIKQFCLKIKEVSSKYNKEGHVWIQNFRIPKEWESDIEEVFDVIYESGIRDIAAWSYMGTKVMSGMASDDPESVWRILGTCFRKAR